MPTSVNQPAMVNTNGVILTIGIRTPQDRTAIVLPLATDSTSFDDRTLCVNAALAFETSVLDHLTAAMGATAFITFLQAEGMIDGKIPVRTDYGPLDHPGARTGPGECSQIAALCVYYCDPLDIGVGQRMRVAKNFIPGLSDTDVGGDYIVDAVQTLLDTFVNAIISGFADTGTPDDKWYRVLATPRTRVANTDLKRVALGMVRRYVGTQRRRLIPRG